MLQLMRVQHRPNGMVLRLMAQANPPAPSGPTSYTVEIPGHEGWPHWVSYPQQQSK